jgi:hypothetical protein
MTQDERKSDVWICRQCQAQKPKTDFRAVASTRHGYLQPCKKCYNAYQRAFQKARPDIEQYRAKQKQANKKYLDAIKEDTFKAYGGKCVCCGETEPKFLSIDHILGDGKEDRKKFLSGRVLYRKLKKQGYPKDRYQLLCFNCNCAKGFFGKCPHQEK